MRARGWRGESSREAPGHEPDRIVQGHGHDVRGFVRAAERIPLGGLRFHRQHFGFDGSVRRARQYAQPGTDSGRENFLGQALAIARLRSPHVSAPHRFRRMRAHPQRTRSAEAGVSAEFGESVSHRGPENRRHRTDGATGVGAAGPHHCSRRQSGKQFGDRQGAA